MSQDGMIKAVYHAGVLQLMEPVELPEGSEVWVQLHPVDESQVPLLAFPTRPQPPETLSRLLEIVNLGGDALADSEALYDADRD